MYNNTTEAIDFLSLELTNQCNLQCTHCYADAGPSNGIKDLLDQCDYENLIREGFDLGAKKIQFIGGEPTLNKNLTRYISYASETGYEFIEVFTNLTRLTSELLNCFIEHNVRLATSVYAPSDKVHDEITKSRGSFFKTIKGITLLLENNIELRIGIIEMEQNTGLVDETIKMLKELGVENIGWDKIRSVGRGDTGNIEELTELCGGCNGKTLCIGPDGLVSPCILSKKMAIGTTKDNSLLELSKSNELIRLQKNLSKKIEIQAVCSPKTCHPYDYCAPKHGPGPCAPNLCMPCLPKG